MGRLKMQRQIRATFAGLATHLASYRELHSIGCSVQYVIPLSSKASLFPMLGNRQGGGFCKRIENQHSGPEQCVFEGCSEQKTVFHSADMLGYHQLSLCSHGM